MVFWQKTLPRRREMTHPVRILLTTWSKLIRLFAVTSAPLKSVFYNVEGAALAGTKPSECSGSGAKWL